MELIIPAYNFLHRSTKNIFSTDKSLLVIIEKPSKNAFVIFMVLHRHKAHHAWSFAH